MEGNLFVTIIALIPMFIILYRIVKENLMADVRKCDIAEYCKEKGFTFYDEAPKFFPGMQFRLLNVFFPSSVCIKNYMSGNSDGIDFAVADFVYARGRGASAHNYTPCYGTIFILNLCNLKRVESMPPFYLFNRKKPLYEMDRSYAVQDVSFGGLDKDFAEKMVVFGTSERDITEFFDDKLCSIFLSLYSEECYCEGCSKTLLFFKPISMELDDRLSFLNKIKDCFKDL